MARIPESDVERLKTEISLVRLIESSGIEIKKSGKDFACRCPFHEGDNEPSLLVSVEKNLFHCFACGAAGSVIDWVMRTRGVSFRHAVELLRNGVFPLAVKTEAVKRSTVRTLDAPIAFDADDQALLNQVIDYYQQSADRTPVYVLFISDGGVSENRAITQLMIEAAKLPIFWQFVGLGGRGYGVLEKLDDMPGRVVDNCSFFALDDLSDISEEQLYDQLMEEFPDWLKAATSAGILG